MRNSQRHKFTDVDLMSVATRVKGAVVIAINSEPLSIWDDNITITRAIEDNIDTSVVSYETRWLKDKLKIILRIADGNTQIVEIPKVR